MFTEASDYGRRMRRPFIAEITNQPRSSAGLLGWLVISAINGRRMRRPQSDASVIIQEKSCHHWVSIYGGN